MKPIDPDGSSRRARIIEGVRPQMALQNTVKQQAQASIRTDKFDYQPGETALITGAGYFPGETVVLQVVHANGQNVDLVNTPFSTGSDGDGQISDQWKVDPDDSRHAIFILTARGESSW